jgi:glutamate dehydrogenase
MLVRKRVGVIKGREERNRILAEMTEEVADLVLADNASQSRALTLDGIRSASRYEEFVTLIYDLVAASVLGRVDDGLPRKEELLASPNRDRGLPRPLLAVVLGQVKRWAFERLMETDFPRSASGRPLLEAYFPRRLRETCREHLDQHALRREIVATVAVNHLVNCAGISFLSRMTAGGKAGIGEVVAAYLDADRASGAPELRRRVVEAGLAAQAEHAALLEIEAGLEAVVRSAVEGGKLDAPAALAAVRGRLK